MDEATANPIIRLTRQQRSDLFAGKHPRIAFPGGRPCPVSVGDVYPLSTRLSIRFTNTARRSKRGDWAPEYVIVDHRDAYLRARLPADPVPATGELDREAKMQAAHESAYTPSKRDEIPGGAGEVPPPAFVKGESTRARARHDERQRAERGESRAKRDVRQFSEQLRELVVRLVRAGLDPLPLLAELEQRCREEKRRLDED